MAARRDPASLLLALTAALALALGAAGCGDDGERSGAEVSPGAGEQRTTSDAPQAGDEAEPGAAEQAGGDAGEAAPGPGETPYDGDGDGDSSDDGSGASPAAPSGGGAAPAEPGGAAPSAPPSTGGVEAEDEIGAGDEEPMAVGASFVVDGADATPARVEVPAFLSIAMDVENAGTRPVQVRLRAPGAAAFTVPPGQAVQRTLTGVPPGLYPLEVDGGASGAVVVAQG